MPSSNPFSSNVTSNTHRNPVQRNRPPTYASRATTAPSYSPSESGSSSAHDPSERVRVWSESLDSDTVFGQPESSLTDTASVGEMSAEMTRPPGPRYVYYRTYAEDGPIPSKNPVYSDDPYLGRILAKRITPPRTAINLRKCLSGAEDIDTNITTSLFISASSQTPMDDSGRVSILAYPGPGCTSHEPMALVAMFSSPPETARVRAPLREGTTPVETQYIYYQVYKERGAVQSKQPADADDPYTGRISVDCIPPPHTAASIMRCISKIEQYNNAFRPSQLFTSTSSESPTSEGDISLLTSDHPGSTPEDPMAVVYSEPWLKQIRVLRVSGLEDDPNWLATTVGEILHRSNEEPQNQPYYNGTQHPAYKAVNNAGKVGFVFAGASYTQPC